jgi:pectate lyase
MKHLRHILLFISINALLAVSGYAAVFLDDTWADGTRTNQNLPAESAWFSSSGAALTAAPNSMNLLLSSSGVMGITYFTTNDTTPLQLSIGDTLTATFRMAFTNVAPPNGSQGFRITLADFADSVLSPKRVSADGFSSSSQGSNVQAYALFQNMGSSLNTAGAMDLRKRTTLNTGTLLSSTTDWSSIGAGPTASNNFPGFAAGTQYTLQFSLKRTGASSMVVSATWSNTANSGFISAAFADNSATNFNFDGIAFRPQQAAQAASNITFLEVRVEIVASPVPPGITTQPTNQTVTEGQSAFFSVGVSGTAPLSYQWFFNTNTLLGDATNATLTLTNVQFPDAGGYSVIVTNPLGSATSTVATLTVTPAAVPPSITSQPEDQIVLAGQGASFSVAATGGTPLSFQWYLNNNAVANATNDTLVFSNTQTNSAGAYFVIVTNAYGAATSDVAILTVNLPSGTIPNFDLVGFATLDGFSTFGYNQSQIGGVSGGAGGLHVQVSTVTSFVNNLQSNATLMVEVMTNLDLSVLANNSGGFPAGYPTGEILVHSNKTIYSKNGSTISRGTLRMGKPSLGPQGNIIIRNLKFRDLWVFDPSGNYDTYGWDYVHLEEGSHHVWVDHCDFETVYDGMIDLSHGSDYLTASWNVFRYQKKCSLIGSSDNNQAEDTNHFNVTYHHNYFVNVAERMPRMRFGNAHVFNIYCENLGAYNPTNNEAGAKGIQSTAGAATLVENVYFYHPQSGTFPTIEANGGPSGIIKVVNSTIVNLPSVNVTFRQFGQTNFAFNYPFATNQPPYPYILDAAADVPYLVTNYAGVGKVAPTFAVQPQSRTVVPGQTAAFSVQVIGASLLAYQWYFNTNTPVPNATNASLTLSSAQATNAGAYFVVASNLFGSATSSVAVLTIGPASVSIVGSPELTNGVFHVQFAGVSNQAYAVDRATNVLGPWQLSYTNLIADPGGLFDLFDAPSPPLPALYYRVRYP